MRKRVFVLPFTILALFAVTVGLNKIRYRYDWSDAMKRTLMASFTGTLWADGFSEKRFSEVSVGMSSVEVKALLGAPLREWCAQGSCTWLYIVGRIHQRPILIEDRYHSIYPDGWMGFGMIFLSISFAPSEVAQVPGRSLFAPRGSAARGVE